MCIRDRNTPIKPNTIADHLLIPINSFKKNFAKIETKNGHEKNKAFAVASGIKVREIKKAEKDFEAKMKELDVDLYKLETAEKQDARKTFSKDWTARIIGIAMVGGFLGYIFLVTLQPPEQNCEAMIILVLGYLGGLASAVISFYFGASNKQD